MLEKFSEAIDLMLDNLTLVAGILLTYIPFEALLLKSIDPDAINPMSPAVALWVIVSLLVSLTIVGALNFAVYQIKSAQHVNYLGAMQRGLQRMGPIFIISIVSGLLILGGAILLIIPGIYLALRFALVIPVVTIENPGVRAALKKSSEMMMGYKIELLGAWILFIIAVAIVSVVLGIMVELMVPGGNLWLELVISSIVQLMAGVMQIVVFLYYWEARAKLDRADSEEDFGETSLDL